MPKDFSRPLHLPNICSFFSLGLNILLSKRSCQGHLPSPAQSTHRVYRCLEPRLSALTCHFLALDFKQRTSLYLSCLICQMGIMQYQPQRITVNIQQSTRHHALQPFLSTEQMLNRGGLLLLNL